MASITRIRPGQTLYKLERRRMGNTTMTRRALYEVRVVEVDPGGKFAIAAINGNQARRCSLAEVAKWSVKKPEPKTMIAGLPSY